MNTPRTHTLPLDLIEVGTRLRPVDPAAVELLAASLEERGLDTPIRVRTADSSGKHRLLAGAHRFTAAQHLGWKSIEVFIVEADDDQALLAEIDENLMRRELSPLDRAVFLAERKAVHERLYPETKRGGSRASGQNDKLVGLTIGRTAFSVETAEKLGLDRRSVERALRRAALEPEIRAALAGHPVSESGAELDKLLALEPAARADAVTRLTRAENGLRNVASALAEMRGPAKLTRAAEQQKQFQALLGAWRKAGKPARKQFLEHLEMEGEVTLPSKGAGKGASP